ncbi:MAG: hypothetical protein GY855_13850 [candidate division Zixibacteria bacterium]|nr:hypothetical protein [candidate division Zixibacteria bacterium]
MHSPKVEYLLFTFIAFSIIFLTVSNLFAGIDDFQVNDFYGPVYQGHSRIAVKSGGDFIITWYDFRSGTNNDIYCQLYDYEGNPQGMNFIVNDDNNGIEQFDPDIAADDVGNFLIVWTDYREAGYPYYPDIYGQFFDNSGQPIAENFVISQNNTSNKAPSVAVDGSGNFIITWYDLRNGNWDIYAQRYAADLTPIGNNFKVNDDTDDGWQHFPRVGAAEDGSFMIVWEDYRRENDDIYCQIYDNFGDPVNTNFLVNSDAGTSRQNFPDIDCDTFGNFIITWQDFRNGLYPDNPDIYLRKYFANGDEWGSEIIVNDDSLLDANQHHPSIAVDDSGNFAVCWDDYRNGEYPQNPDIYFQKFAPDLTTEDSNIKVNTGSDEQSQVYPDISLSGLGAYFTWTDKRIICNDFDVYASMIDWSRIREPDLYIRPRSLDFGLVRIGDTAEDDFIISNVGTAGLMIDSMVVSGNAYNVTNFSGNLYLGPGYDTTIVVEFSPPDSFAYDAAINIFTNDPDSSVAQVELTGRGYRNDFSPTEFDLLQPDSATVSADTTISFIWSSSNDNDAGDYVRFSFKYSQNSNFFDSTLISNITDTTITVDLPDNSIIYWEVIAYDRYGETTRCSQWGWHVYLDTGPDSPHEFSKIYPVNNSAIGNMLPVLKWHSTIDPDYGGEVSYTCFFADNDAFDSALVFEMDSDTTIALDDSLSDNATYYWKVAAVDLDSDTTWANNTYWNFHIDRTQQIPAPFDLISPENNSIVNSSGIFIWASSSDPDPDDTLKYELWYSLDSTFGSSSVISGLIDTTYQMPVLQDNNIYYWKVNVSDLHYNSRWSNQTDWKFLTNNENDPPGDFDIISPPRGSTVGPDGIAFRWEESVDPDPMEHLLYRLYVSKNTEPDSEDILTTTADPIHIDFDYTDAGSYYWQVEAFDSAGALTLSSGAPYLFTVGTENPLADFSLIAPSDSFSLIGKTAYFVWEASTGSESIIYNIRYAPDTILYNAVKYNTTPDTFKLMHFFDYGRDSSIYWNVEAIAEDGSVKRCNQDYWMFILGGGDDYRLGFDLLWPENGDSIRESRPEFIWSSAPELNLPGIVRYKLYYDTNPLFSMPSIMTNIADTFATPSRPLVAGETFYWKVDAVVGSTPYCTNFNNFSFFTDIIISVDTEDIVPHTNALYPPFPNPFNSTASIRFETAEPAEVRIIVYNILGQKVKEVVSDYYLPGDYVVQWNSRTDNGGSISSGLYLVVMHVKDTRFCKKMILLK